MSTEVIAASFRDAVIIEPDEDETTTIGFSDYENSRTKMPPLATATVYETELLPENRRNYFDRHDSFDAISGDDDDDDDDDPFHCHSYGSDSDDESRDEEEEILDRLRCVDNCLKKKVTEILLKNPWLASTIVRRPNGKLAMKFKTELTQDEAEKRSVKVVRVVTTLSAGRSSVEQSPMTTRRALAASHAPSATEIIIADPITEDTYEEIIDSIRPLLYVSTESVVGKQHCSLWNVLLIPLRVKSTFARSNKFLLVHSLDSCLADPATLYRIYGMLSANRLVERLDPHRCPHLESIKKELLGGDPNVLRSTAVQAGNAKRKLLAKSKAYYYNNRTSVWTVNSRRILNWKQQHQQKKKIRDDILSLDPEPEVSYISTNDILTSWFLSRNKDAAIGCLVADLRDRDPTIHSAKAGNYQAEIIYNTRDEKFHDARTPSWIRASLERTQDEKLKRHEDRSLPGFHTLSGGLSTKAPGATIVSNWSSLCQTLSLEHDGGFLLKPGIHLPVLLEAHGGFYSTIGWRSMVIFRYSEDKLGVVITAPPSATRGTHIPLDRPAVFQE